MRLWPVGSQSIAKLTQFALSQPPPRIAKNQRPVVLGEFKHGIVYDDKSAAVAGLQHVCTNLVNSLVLGQDRRDPNYLLPHVLSEPGLHLPKSELFTPTGGDDHFRPWVGPEHILKSRQEFKRLLDVWYPMQDTVEVEVDAHAQLG